MKGFKVVDYISFPFPKLSWRNRCDLCELASSVRDLGGGDLEQLTARFATLQRGRPVNRTNPPLRAHDTPSLVISAICVRDSDAQSRGKVESIRTLCPEGASGRCNRYREANVANRSNRSHLGHSAFCRWRRTKLRSLLATSLPTARGDLQ